jgi:hypothetical protein
VTTGPRGNCSIKTATLVPSMKRPKDPSQDRDRLYQLLVTSCRRCRECKVTDCTHSFLHSRQRRGVDAPVERPTGGSSVEVEPEAVPATSQLLHSKSSEGGRFCVVGCRSLSPPFSRLRVNRLTDGHFVRQAVEVGYGLTFDRVGAAKSAAMCSASSARPAPSASDNGARPR